MLVHVCRRCVEESRQLSRSEMLRANRHLLFWSLVVCLTSLVFYIHYTLAPTQVFINYIVGDMLSVFFLAMIWGLSIANLVVVYEARNEVKQALDSKPFLRFMDINHKGQFTFSNPAYATQFAAINPTIKTKHVEGAVWPRYHILPEQLIGPILFMIFWAFVSLLA